MDKPTFHCMAALHYSQIYTWAINFKILSAGELMLQWAKMIVWLLKSGLTHPAKKVKRTLYSEKDMDSFNAEYF